MAKIIAERMTARMEGDFVVFMIGMRVNKWWQIGKWVSVAMSMPKMLIELYKNPESGFKGGQAWFGRTTIMVQYWESFEKLDTYAKNKDANHYPAWVNFNKKIKSSGAVGIWHETYKVLPENYENIYSNMPPFGLGKAGKLLPAKGNYHSARERLMEKV